MSIRVRLRTIACCTMLEFAALAGVPVRPEEVQNLLRTLNQPKIARTEPDESRAPDNRIDPRDGSVPESVE